MMSLLLKLTVFGNSSPLTLSMTAFDVAIVLYTAAMFYRYSALQ